MSTPLQRAARTAAVLALLGGAPALLTACGIGGGSGAPTPTIHLPPTVTALSANESLCDGNITVTVTGTNFKGATRASFGGTDGTNLLVQSDTQLTVTSPAHAAGLVDFTVTTPGGTSRISHKLRYAYRQLYLTDQNNNRIVRVDDMAGTGFVAFGTAGSGTGNFSQPTGLSVGRQGKIYVADTFNNRIVRIDDMQGNGFVSFGTNGSGTGQLALPSDVSLDSEDRVHVADTSNHRIVRMDNMQGNNFLAFGNQATVGSPLGVCLAARSRIFVPVHSPGVDNITRFDDMLGNNPTTYGTSGAGIGSFSTPSSVAVANDGKIYVADFGNNRIVRMDDVQGNGFVTYGSLGSSTGNFALPISVRPISSGQIFVCDQNNNRIVRIDDMAGTNFRAYKPTGAQALNFPSGIAIH